MNGLCKDKARKVTAVSRAMLIFGLACSALTLNMSAKVFAQDQSCVAKQNILGEDCVIVAGKTGRNTKVSQRPDDAPVPFKISVDGEEIVGAETDLDSLDIQVKFDGLDAKQILNACAEIKSKETGVVQFRTSTNYASFIKRGEIRVFKIAGKDETKITASDPIAVVDVSNSDLVEWNAGSDSLKDYYYVYRVYDEDGRFDETGVKPIVDKTVDLDVTKAGADITGDEAKVRNISVYGGAVTVLARDIPQGYQLSAFGKKVTVDASNQVLMQQILPTGDQEVVVAVAGGKGQDLQFSRQVNIPKNDWFYVGIADFTYGHRLGNHVEIAAPGEFERSYTKGRLAFYLKGKIKGKYLLTASMDTQEGDVKDLFKNLDKKDPRSLLRRLDPDDYYPIYGDDSTVFEDAPTSGKAYVRIERGQNHVMWGNFKTTINGTEFARVERGLYGAHGVYKSQAVTTFGEPKVKVEGFAAQPGTVPQRDVFDGTGGSAYFLAHQDVNKGSEQVVVEFVDEVTKQVISRKTLKEGTDYRFDYIQGVIILNTPLARNGSAGKVVNGGGIGGQVSRLVVNYETTPTIGDQNGLTAAARGEGWVNDHVRFGTTVSQETIATQRNNKIEADVVLRATDKTHLTLEVAQSEGQGIGQSMSSDGGLTFKNEAPVGARGQKALAYRVKAEADLSEVTNGALRGTADAYYEFREAGFSAVSNETAKDTSSFGANVELKVTDDVVMRMSGDGIDAGANERKYRANGELEAQIAENWKLAAGVTWTQFTDPSKPYQNGDRTDVGAKLTHQLDEETSIFAYGQASVSRSGNRRANNRIGVGGETQLTERFGVAGDISYGSTGVGATAKVTYKRDADTSYYLGYTLDPDRATYPEGTNNLIGRDNGVIVAGANTKLNDWTSAFTESNIDMFGRSRTIGQVYGLTFTPDEVWSSSLGMSLGTVSGSHDDDFDRKLFMARGAYAGERLKVSVNSEVRIENYENNAKDRTTYLFQANANYKTDENWRVLASLDAVLSNSNETSILDGDYIEASIGSTYRPIDNDNLNALFKYTYLHDLPGPQQVNVNNVRGPSQRSHVLIADATYDINQWLSLGAKYGYRYGSSSATRLKADYVKNTAHLGILRADLHVVKNWDVLLEGRALRAVEAAQTQYGALLAGYRHFGDNLKVGVGYNFGRFSDDLTDLVHDDSGVFMNVIGKF